MKHPKLIIILLVLFAAILFAVVNRPLLSSRAEINLLFLRTDAAVGWVLLGVAALSIFAALIIGLNGRLRYRDRMKTLERELSKARKVAVDNAARSPGDSGSEEIAERFEAVEDTVREENEQVSERVAETEKHLREELRNEPRDKTASG